MIDLHLNNLFQKIRQQSGAIADDATPTNGASVPVAEKVNARATNMLAYWTGTGKTGTVTFLLYVYDGINDKYVLQSKVTGVAPESVTVLKAYGASCCYVALDDTGAAAGTTNAQVWAYAHDLS